MSKMTIRSVELRDQMEKHTCQILRKVEKNKLLVTVYPPYPGHAYNRSGEISQFVLAPRHEGSILVPKISEWPCHVHMCVPKNEGNWENGPFEILDWGVLEVALP